MDDFGSGTIQVEYYSTTTSSSGSIATEGAIRNNRRAHLTLRFSWAQLETILTGRKELGI